MGILRGLRDELHYDGLSRKDFRKVQDAIWEDNRTAVIVWSLSASLFWIMSLVLSLNSDAYRACRWVYVGALICCLITLTGALFLARRSPRTLSPITRMLEISLFGAGIGIAICQPDVRTVTLIASSTIIPVATIKRTSATLVVQCAAILAYALLAKGIIVREIYSWGLLNLIIFSTVGLLVGHYVNRTRFERYVYEDSAKKLAEIQKEYAYVDQMTGLRNRRAYSEALERLGKDAPDGVCVIVADVNGLKQTNDSLGHAAGDELIVATAICLSSVFGDTGNIYRIGGDEFCVLIPGSGEEVSRRLEELDRHTETWTGRYVAGFTVSYGVATSQDCRDLEAVCREADARMYEHKRSHYAQRGKHST